MSYQSGPQCDWERRKLGLPIGDPENKVEEEKAAACAIPVPVVDPVKLSRKRTAEYVTQLTEKFTEKLSESAIKQRRIELAEEEKHRRELLIKDNEATINGYIDNVYELLANNKEVLISETLYNGTQMLGVRMREEFITYITDILDKLPNIKKTVTGNTIKYESKYC